jgi:hypothetical protein
MATKMYLRKTGPERYAIFGPSGNQMSGDFTSCHKLQDALDKARQWASSWPAVEVIYDDKQD